MAGKAAYLCNKVVRIPAKEYGRKIFPVLKDSRIISWPVFLGSCYTLDLPTLDSIVDNIFGIA